ncbi:MAG: tRNA (adenosine(37)-N6)-threonylcarbamoyltransferase complex transferase subunit TsaD [Candidatus Paceibacterota bacterium]
MNILSIETSCDETGVSLVKCSYNKNRYHFEVLGNNLISQADLHATFGGVFPSLAKREHAKAIIPLIEKTLRDGGVREAAHERKNLDSAKDFLEREPETKEALERLTTFDTNTIDAIAVTVGPGLSPALWVGVNTARALSTLWNKPLIPTNHMHGHIFSSLFPSSRMFDFPALALLVSGGHTELLAIKEDLSIEILGATRDDAIGEAFDKAARLLGLGYPGGALISKEAEKHRDAYPTHTSTLFPRPMIKDDSFDVSYSGLKTALLYHLRDNPIQDASNLSELSREFEDAALDVIVSKTEKALKTGLFASLTIGGGVIANTELRKRLIHVTDSLAVPLYIPEMGLTTDNSLMIAIAAFVSIQNKKMRVRTELKDIEVRANMSSSLFY